MKILFVCSSNVCRSPYAELMLKKLVSEDRELAQRITWIKSAAVFNRSKKLFPKARVALSREGISDSVLDSHQPRFKKDAPELFAEADIIIGMTRTHKYLTPKKYRDKYKNMSEVAVGYYKAVPDPFLAKSQAEYDKCMETLKKYIYQYFDKLKSE